MATPEASRARAPRGAKTVVSAFLAALDDIPDARRVEVAKAAQVAIREEVKLLAEKAKEAARKPVGRKPVARKAAAPKKIARKTAASKKQAVAAPEPAPAAAPARRAKRTSAAAATA